MQTLNVLQNDFTSFLAGAGTAIFLSTISAAVLRSNVLPKWLGWIGLVLAVAALTLPFVGIIGVGVWTLIACIILLATKPPTFVVAEQPVTGMPVVQA